MVGAEVARRTDWPNKHSTLTRALDGCSHISLDAFEAALPPARHRPAEQRSTTPKRRQRWPSLVSPWSIWVIGG